MKISPQQILASAGGAVVAALLASFFGVSGTIIGVAVGSVVATTASAVVAESIERSRRAVRQVAVRLPTGTTVLRRTGSTAPAGRASVDVEGEPPAVVTGESATGDPATSAARGPRSRSRPRAVAEPSDRSGPALGRRTLRWRWLALATVVVFAVSLLVVTLIELGAGKPLSALVGSHPTGGSAPSVGEILGAGSSPTPTTVPPAPTTTAPTTTTTAPGQGTTTTSGPGATTTTTAPGSTTTAPAGGPATTTPPVTTVPTTAAGTPAPAAPAPGGAGTP